MFGKWPNRITVFSSPRAACTKSASVPITAINVFVFIVLSLIRERRHNLKKSRQRHPAQPSRRYEAGFIFLSKTSVENGRGLHQTDPGQTEGWLRGNPTRCE